MGNPKNPKYLENEERCHGVSHILTRYRFIGFFGSWLGGGLSLSPSIVKVRVAGWWSLSLCLLLSLGYGWLGGGLCLSLCPFYRSGKGG